MVGVRPRSPRTRNAVILVSDLICRSLSFLGCKPRIADSSDPWGLLSEFSKTWLFRALLTQSLARKRQHKSYSVLLSKVASDTGFHPGLEEL